MAENCRRCGQFVGRGGICYTPFGGPEDEEPPPDKFICPGCWHKMSALDKQLLHSVSWLKPTIIPTGELAVEVANGGRGGSEGRGGRNVSL